MHPDDQWKTAFQTRYGVYDFVVVPLGLAGAPATFQRLMQEVFTDELDEFITIYLDDVLVFSRTWEEHIRHLRAREAKKTPTISKGEEVLFSTIVGDLLRFQDRARGN